jgi:hypothetical protein
MPLLTVQEKDAAHTTAAPGITVGNYMIAHPCLHKYQGFQHPGVACVAKLHSSKKRDLDPQRTFPMAVVNCKDELLEEPARLVLRQLPAGQSATYKGGFTKQQQVHGVG